MNKDFKAYDITYTFSMVSILVIGVAHLYFGSISADGRYSLFFTLGVFYCTIPGMMMAFSISNSLLFNVANFIISVIGPIYLVKHEGWGKGLLASACILIVSGMVSSLATLMDEKKKFRQVFSFVMNILGMEETMNLMQSKRVELTESQRRQE